MAPGPTFTVLLRAREVVEKIYAEIGVRVIWHSTTSHPSGCSVEAIRDALPGCKEAVLVERPQAWAERLRQIGGQAVHEALIVVIHELLLIRAGQADCAGRD